MMKQAIRYRAFSVLTILILWSTGLFAQSVEQARTFSFPPDDPRPGTTYEARDQISIKESIKGDYRFLINEDIPLSADYLASSEVINPTSREDFLTSSSRVVGTTPGSAGVSPTGAATYSIPIQVPPGTGGMVPGISVNYSSQSGNGILGMGWGLAGISAITRSGNTPYHDGRIRGVFFDADDRFLLDGQRLIAVTGRYGYRDAEYHTEVESFSVIRQFGGTPGNPDYFTVETADGKTLTYGNQPNSVLNLASDRPLAWFLTRVEDHLGNYMTYHYTSTKANGEVVLKRIEYTGNAAAGFTPYNSVEFFYEERSDTRTGYTQGMASNSTQLLYAIKTYCEDNLVKKYQFNYYLDDYTHLNSIDEYDAYGNKYNATVVGWGDAANGINVEVLRTYNGTTHFGEFNGDGRKDMLVRNRIVSPGQAEWDLYLSNGESFSLVSSAPQASNLNGSGILIIDTDGDGIDEILRKRYDDDDPTDVETDYCLNKVNQDDFTINPIDYFEVNDYAHSEQFGDIDGDGIPEMFYLKTEYEVEEEGWWIFKEEVVYETAKTRIRSFDGTVGRFNAISNDYEDVSIYLVDIDGDGRANPCVKSGNLKVFGCDESGTFSAIPRYYGISFGSSKRHLGDFNGDGITDILSYYPNLDVKWKILLGTGNGWITTSGFKTLQLPDPPAREVRYRLQVADANQDGMDDIICVEGQPTGTGNAVYTTIKVFYSNGNDFNLYSKTVDGLHTDFTTNAGSDLRGLIDYDGDGKLELVHNGGSSSWVYLIQFKPNDQKHLVTHISNGLNQLWQWNYSTLAKQECYTPDLVKPSNFAVFNMNGPMWVVRSFSGQNGLGSSMNRVNYSYEGAKLHKFGKGFLGFSAIEVHDDGTDFLTRTVYELDNNYYFMAPDVLTTWSESSDISTVDYTNDAFDSYPDKRYIPFTPRTTTTDHLNGNTTTQTNEIDFSTGLPEWDITDYGNGTSVRNDYTYTSVDGIWRPYTHTITRTRNGESDVRSTTNTYFANATLKDVTNHLGLKTAYTYDACGNLLSTTLSYSGLTSRSSSQTYELPYRRFVESKTNALGHTAHFKNDPRFGVVTQKTDANGLVSTFEYDHFGRNTHTTSALGIRSTTTLAWAKDTYTNSLYQKTTSTPGSPSATVYYDKLGRAIHGITTGWNGQVIHTETEYYATGKVENKTAPYVDGDPLHTTRYIYNNNQQLIRVDGPNCDISYSYPPNQTTVTDCMGRSKSTYYHPDGTVDYISDQGGTISYAYNALGKVTSINTNGILTEIKYDDFGRQDTLIDPDAGTMAYRYNAYGELMQQTNARGQTTLYTYDNLGRTLSETGPDINTTYEYDTDMLGKLTSLTGSNTTTTYAYDRYGRVEHSTKNYNGKSYTRNYSYNGKGQLDTCTYPGGFAVQNHYDSDGFLTHVTRADNGSNQMLWRCNAMNKRGQVTHSTLGNLLQEWNTYDEFGYPTRIYTQNMGAPIPMLVQNFDFDWQTSNLLSRQDSRPMSNVNLGESFMYDELDRLDTITRNGLHYGTRYDNTGNITAKYDAGHQYDYTTSRPHAVSAVHSLEASMGLFNQRIQYNSFEQPYEITQGTKRLDIIYDDADQNRIHSIYDNGLTGDEHKSWERIYLGDYEEVHIAGQPTRYLNYFAGGIHVQNEGGTEETYYLTTDYLGSPQMITDQNQNIVQEYSYNAWGRRRNAHDWDEYEHSYHPLFYRGFTGHEHLSEFGLINMNGRLYDPLLGRMLSPDNYVQSATSTQSFNRYSYCWNNPLKYTDPSGEFLIATFGLPTWFVLMDKAVTLVAKYGWKAYQGYQSYQTIKQVSQNPMATCTGIAISIGLNYGFGLLGQNIDGVFPSMLYYGGTGAITGGVSAGVTAEMSGEDFWDAAYTGAIIGAFRGAVQGGVQGGISAYNGEENIWWGGEVAGGRSQWSIKNTPTLDYKLNDYISQNHSKKELELFYGNPNIKIGTNKNLKEFGAYNSDGIIRFKSGETARGFAKGGVVTDGKYIKTEIRISKDAVRNIDTWGAETIEHEFKHASDNFLGIKMNNVRKYGALKASKIAEQRAYYYNYLRTGDKMYLYKSWSYSVYGD